MYGIAYCITTVPTLQRRASCDGRVVVGCCDKRVGTTEQINEFFRKYYGEFIVTFIQVGIQCVTSVVTKWKRRQESSRSTLFTNKEIQYSVNYPIILKFRRTYHNHPLVS